MYVDIKVVMYIFYLKMVAVAVGQSVYNLISSRLLEELLLQFVNLIVILFVITGNALRKYI